MGFLGVVYGFSKVFKGFLRFSTVFKGFFKGFLLFWAV